MRTLRLGLLSRTIVCLLSGLVTDCRQALSRSWVSSLVRNMARSLWPHLAMTAQVSLSACGPRFSSCSISRSTLAGRLARPITSASMWSLITRRVLSSFMNWKSMLRLSTMVLNVRRMTDLLSGFDLRTSGGWVFCDLRVVSTSMAASHITSHHRRKSLWDSEHVSRMERP